MYNEIPGQGITRAEYRQSVKTLKPMTAAGQVEAIREALPFMDPTDISLIFNQVFSDIPPGIAEIIISSYWAKQNAPQYVLRDNMTGRV